MRITGNMSTLIRVKIHDNVQLFSDLYTDSSSINSYFSLLNTEIALVSKIFEV